MKNPVKISNDHLPRKEYEVFNKFAEPVGVVMAVDELEALNEAKRRFRLYAPMVQPLHPPL